MADDDPRVARSKSVIIDAARGHFLEHGYLAASLDDIAARARVSKRTIYNIYGGKERLFRAVITDVFDTAERFAAEVVESHPADDGNEGASQLRTTGVRLARTVLGGSIVPLRRLLVGEVSRFPELAREYYERAPGRVIAALAATLHQYAERGRLNLGDPMIAAEHFAYLVLGAALDRAMFEPNALSAEEVDRRAHAGVDVFLRAYASVPS